MSSRRHAADACALVPVGSPANPNKTLNQQQGTSTSGTGSSGTSE
jgi:hypothetical protein